MNRRNFLVGATGLAATPYLTGCSVLGQFAGLPTTVSVNMSQLEQAIMRQQCPEWCWAASISMIFAFYGHPISQAQIVAQTYGAVTCLPAVNNAVIGTDLSRTYVDNLGRKFTSTVTAAFDPQNGYNSLSWAGIANELANDRPLVYCNTHHCEVIYSMTYDGFAANPIVTDVDVIDPWPTNPPAHSLTASEVTPVPLGGEMMFVAAVRVS